MRLRDVQRVDSRIKGGRSRSGKIVHSYTGLAITPHPLPSVPRHPSYSVSMAPPWLSVKLDVPADMATDDSEPSEVVKSVIELMEVGRRRRRRRRRRQRQRRRHRRRRRRQGRGAVCAMPMDATSARRHRLAVAESRRQGAPPTPDSPPLARTRL